LTTSQNTILSRFRSGLIFGLVAGVLLYVGYALWVGWEDVAEALRSFLWRWLPVLLLLSLGNYLVRFVRWEAYLRTLEIQIPFRSSMAIFLCGLAMTITPGKVGEFLKSYLLKESHGVPMATSAPVVFAERVTDLLALVLLASVGVASYGGPKARLVLGLAGGCVALALVVLQSNRLTAQVLSLVEGFPLGARIAPKLREVLDASRALLALRPLLVGLVLAILAWFLECYGYWLAFDAFPVPVDMDLGVAVFAYSFSTVAGVVSPGGIGPTDVGLIELARTFTPDLADQRELAAAASFIVRVCTLWFAVGLGALALLRFRTLVEVDVEVARSGESQRSNRGGPEAPVSTQ